MEPRPLLDRLDEPLDPARCSDSQLCPLFPLGLEQRSATGAREQGDGQDCAPHSVLHCLISTPLCGGS